MIMNDRTHLRASANVKGLELFSMKSLIKKFFKEKKSSKKH